MGSEPVADATSAETLVGEKYRLARLIGRGAFGNVYEAEHTQVGRRYAVKLLQRGPESPRARQRFAREARVLARLEHENIVGLVDAGEDPVVGEYLVLEFIRGTTLRAALATMRTEPLQRTLEVLRQLARGLGHAHAAGVVHRDLKPENVMLTSHADGRLLVKILDFGIARLFDSDEELVTTSGAALGTAGYMAPEQARGERDLDNRVDVYALGVIAYEALSGVRPFAGDSYNETLFRIITEKHRPLAESRPDVAPALCEVIERALSKDRAHRFATVEDFSLALRDAEPDVRRETVTLDTGERASPLSTLQPVPATPAVSHALRPKRVSAGTLGAAVLGFALGAGFDRLSTFSAVSEARKPLEKPLSSAVSAPKESTLPSDLRGAGTQPAASPAPAPSATETAPTPSASTEGRKVRTGMPSLVRPPGGARRDRGF